MASLPFEHDAGEIAASACEQFTAAVTDGLMTMETFARKRDDSDEPDSDTRQQFERRSLLSWCSLFAKPGAWRSVRSLSLWCKRSPAGHLQVAIHQRLFGQINRRHLIPNSHRKFVELCELYGLGVSGRTSKSAFVELSPEFLADLASVPCEEEGEGERDVASRVRGKDDLHSPSPSHAPSSSEDGAI
jgi:hypothetical protein